MTKVTALRCYPEKGKPAIELTQAKLVAHKGMEGDRFMGSGRPLSFLTENAVLWVKNQEVKGLCFNRFQPNIRLSDFKQEEMVVGRRFSVGQAVLEYESGKGVCHAECARVAQKLVCKLAQQAFFAQVIKDGTVEIGDPVNYI